MYFRIVPYTLKLMQKVEKHYKYFHNMLCDLSNAMKVLP